MQETVQEVIKAGADKVYLADHYELAEYKHTL